MTKEEQDILNMTADLWNAILDLPVLHPLDMKETQRDIHNIQHRIMARKAYRVIIKKEKQNETIKKSNKGTD